MRDLGPSPVLLLVEALHNRCGCLEDHGRRVRDLTRLLGWQMDLPEHDLRLLSEAARLHDIGKAFVPCSILTKAGALTAGEAAKVRQHPIRGAQVLSLVPAYPAPLADWVLRHHEHFDGTGYPGGLRGTEIPLGSRLIALADAWDAMTSGRAYQSPRRPDACLEEIADLAGRQFDPSAVEALLALHRAGRLVPRGAEATVPTRRGKAQPTARAALPLFDSESPGASERLAAPALGGRPYRDR